MGDTWWVIIICPCVNVFSLTGGVTEADVGFPTECHYTSRLTTADKRDTPLTPEQTTED